MQCTYKVPIFDAEGNHLGDELTHINTENVNQQQVWDWIGEQVDAEGWAPQMIVVKYLDGKIVNKTITIQFKMPETVESTNLVFGLLGADSCESLNNPEEAVVDMGRQIGVYYDINTLKYVDPDTVDTTPGVTSDWEVPGSPIGPPFGPAWKEWFEWTAQAQGYEMHSTFVGESGTRYIAILTPTGAKKTVTTEMIWQISK